MTTQNLCDQKNVSQNLGAQINQIYNDTQEQPISISSKFFEFASTSVHYWTHLKSLNSVFRNSNRLKKFEQTFQKKTPDNERIKFDEKLQKFDCNDKLNQSEHLKRCKSCEVSHKVKLSTKFDVNGKIQFDHRWDDNYK